MTSHDIMLLIIIFKYIYNVNIIDIITKQINKYNIQVYILTNFESNYEYRRPAMCPIE